jgi:hypothetical protein
MHWYQLKLLERIFTLIIQHMIWSQYVCFNPSLAYERIFIKPICLGRHLQWPGSKGACAMPMHGPVAIVLELRAMRLHVHACRSIAASDRCESHRMQIASITSIESLIHTVWTQCDTLFTQWEPFLPFAHRRTTAVQGQVRKAGAQQVFSMSTVTVVMSVAYNAADAHHHSIILAPIAHYMTEDSIYRSDTHCNRCWSW